ncbi:MAG TPA: cyclic nucleotide-binding domain-containing protein [Desulfuromonadales bacterium]|nr:cyclic nucleotide-binding domain-containing protein [Desulfuromonadales bacterium]
MQNIDFDNIPLLKNLNRLERAGLVPRLVREERSIGEIIVNQGDRGEALYIVLAGTVGVSRFDSCREKQAVATLGPGECFGEMSLLAGLPRSASVEAKTAVSLLRLSRNNFEKLLQSNPTVSYHLATLLARRFGEDPTGSENGADTSKNHIPDLTIEAAHHPGSLISKGGVAIRGLFANSAVISLLGTLLICAFSYTLLSHQGLSKAHAVLTTLLFGATILWSLDVFSYHVVTIALPLIAVLFGVAAPEKAFSGFSSPSWFLVLGVFAITAAISRTGLMYRLVLLIVRRFPPHYGMQTFALALSGLLLTPVIPSSNGRAALAGPLAATICETLRFRKGSRGAIGISLSCLLGFGHMSFMFMNGTATCFLALGLLPPDVISRVTWTSWLVSSLPLALAYFLISFVMIMFLYRPKLERQNRAQVITAQLKALGPMTRQEKVSLVTVVVSLVAFASQSLHQINGAWIAMLSFLILFASGVLNEKSVRTDIDWNFLISFGALVGFGALISTSGLTDVAAAKIRPWLLGASGSPFFFLPVVSLATQLIRFALPLPAALLVGILSIVPLSSTIGIHPFVIALVLLVSVNPWIVPYQNSIYLNMLESTEGKLFTHKQARPLAYMQAGAVLLAIISAIPWWRFIGMIR